MGRAARARRGVIDTRALERPRALGIDIGGVLVDRVAEDSDTSFFGDRPMDTPLVAGSLEAVQALIEMFEWRVYIVSKAGPKIAELSRAWLGRHGFVGPEMIPPSQVHFVRKRPDKADVCERLGITHFVDDRLDVLDHLVTVDRRFLFTGGLGAQERAREVPESVIEINHWSRIVSLLRAECCRD